MLEYRQLELIARCNIDRQYRMISQHFNSLGEAESKGAKIVAEWHRQALMHPDAWERQLDEEAGTSPPMDLVELPDGDERFTPLIANRYANLRELMEIHQRELGAAVRRRRQAIAMLFEMQYRRKRAGAVPDAEVVNVGDA